MGECRRPVSHKERPLALPNGHSLRDAPSQQSGSTPPIHPYSRALLRVGQPAWLLARQPLQAPGMGRAESRKKPGRWMALAGSGLLGVGWNGC